MIPFAAVRPGAFQGTARTTGLPFSAISICFAAICQTT